MSFALLLSFAAACTDGSTLVADDTLGPDSGGTPVDVDAGHCTFEDRLDGAQIERKVPVGATFGGGCNACTCNEDGPLCTAAACLPGTPRQCEAQADCPGGVCLFDPGCDRPQGFCCYTGHCTDPLTAGELDMAAYCACDGRTISPGPRAPYAHLGACPGFGNGAGCSADAECSSGYCVDGVCCEGPCRGECMACDAAGMCIPESAGEDAAGDCSRLACDGVGACQDRRACAAPIQGVVQAMQLSPDGEAVLAYQGAAPRGGLVLAWHGADCEARLVRRFESPGVVVVQGLTVDAAGGVAVTGWFFDTLDVGGGPLSVPGAAASSFVARFNAAGVLVSAFAFSGGPPGSQLDIAGLVALGDGDVVLAGSVARPIDFGLGVLPPQRLGSVFVVRFSPEGTPRYARLFGDAGGQSTAAALAKSPSGEVVVAGAFSNQITVGTATLTANGRGAFLIALDADGEVASARIFGEGDRSTVPISDIDFTPEGDLIVAGQFSGRYDFGAGPLASVGGTDLLVARIGWPDTVQWTRRFGGLGNDRVIDLAASAGDIRISSLYTGELDLGQGQPILQSRYNGSALMLRLDGAGQVLGADPLNEMRPGPVAGAFAVGLLDDYETSQIVRLSP